MAVNRQYKSSVFTLLFSDPDRLRELYNALASKRGTLYDESAKITINTLSDVMFMERINDVSFTIDDKLVVLLEHQSTINPNMAVRLLLYIGRIYEKLIDNKRLYSSKQLSIPRPEFIVLYNGPGECPASSVVKLSDHFEKAENHDSIDLELVVTVYNINHGRNPDLEKQSKTLADYALLIAKIREYETAGLGLENALKKAINWCIKQDTLRVFLETNASEVQNMLLTEWNMDDALAVRYEEGVEDGLSQGLSQVIQKQLEIARNMKSGGVPENQIAGYTGLPVGEVAKL
ncbi:hypothetical protein AGMMS50230_14260 [Spirochaetia bacterium]|nr:hypothetical protein AGMMS50230_14260 [Spirochaetia bacterium]